MPADQGIHVPFVDIHVFADELASYGPEVRVVEPAELRDQVIARLEAARAAARRGRMIARKPLIATDRAALMLQLVPYLIGKGEVSIAEAADEFDVTPDQMRAMVETLTVIGLPGDGGYWQMANDLFDIDWDLLDERDIIVITNSVGLERAPKLTAREAAALLTGLQLARAIPGVGDTELFAGPARQARSRRLQHAGRRDPRARAGRRRARRGRRGAAAAAWRSRSPTRRRMPHPRRARSTRSRCSSPTGEWYLQGWCHLRQAMRTFHLDRVSDLELTDIAIEHGEDPVPGWFETGRRRHRRPHPVPGIGRPAARATTSTARRSRPPTASRSRRCASPTSTACDASPRAARGPSRSSSPSPRAERPPRGRKRGSCSTVEVPWTIPGQAAAPLSAGYTGTTNRKDSTCCKVSQDGTS